MTRPVCVVLGVGPGVGFAVAKRFAREGFTVAMVARRSQVLAQLTDELIENGYDAKAFYADVGDEGKLLAVLEDIKARCGIISVLVYNAATPRQELGSRTLSTDYLADFRVNVLGGILASQRVLADMKSERSGTILFTGGGLALHPLPDFASLAVGKAAVRSYALSLAAEVKALGVHVATVTICGIVQPGGSFDPERIAEAYWELHSQAPADWVAEVRIE